MYISAYMYILHIRCSMKCLTEFRLPLLSSIMVSPPSVRGTYGSFIQISTCLGLMGALLIGIPVKSISGWWRICFWLSTIPSTLLALAMIFCAESPHWLYKRGRNDEAEVEFQKLLGPANVISAMAELLKSDRGDENDTVTISELIYGRHFWFYMLRL